MMPLMAFRVRYLISQKAGIAYAISHIYARINIDFYDSWPLEKKLALHNVIIHIKSVFNKDQHHYFYNTFLEKCSYQLAKIIATNFFHSIIMLIFVRQK